MDDGRALMQEISNRDRLERAFSDAYEIVMGEPMEWASNYNEAEALGDMELRMRRYELKPAFAALKEPE